MRKTVFLFFFSLLFACTKPGTGGKAAIKGVVKNSSKPIPGANVYIKYGATQSPGTNVTYYDASVTADANANYEFSDLKRGDYYLFAWGYDSVAGKTVDGGVAAVIKSKTETVNLDIPVNP